MATVLHVKAELDGPSNEVNRFFDIVKADELMRGHYLNDILAFSTLNQSTRINAIEFFIKYVFRSKLAVVNAYAQELSIPQMQRLKSFLKSNAPVGTAFVVLDYYEVIWGLMADDDNLFISLDDDNSYLSLS